ncbi:MAG: ImmA/IrrE family metallo-endopeptidase [Planctomycetota bacterium]
MTGVDLRFLDTPSLEGMFVRDPGLRIFVPSTEHRPVFRLRMTCAHELGHQQLNHGTTADRFLIEKDTQHRTKEEYQADIFAAFLMMPRPAVLAAFARRGCTPSAVSPLEVLVTATELGVGYTTLLTHSHFALKILNDAQYRALKKSSPKSIRSELQTGNTEIDLVVDEAYSAATLDLEVGDRVAFVGAHPEQAQTALEMLSGCQVPLGVAKIVGTHRLRLNNGVYLSIRTARKHYVGPYENRFLEEPLNDGK